MKIAWIKYSGSMEFGEHLVFTSGTADIRAQLFENLLRAGHELYFYSKLSKETQKYINTPEGKKRFGKIKIREEFEIKDEVDFVVVESGATNTNFTTMIKGQKIPAITHTYSLLKSYSGLVFYLQIDLDLYFVYFPEFFSKKYMNEFLGYGNFVDIFENKTWVILNPAKRNFFDFNDTARSQYKGLYENKFIRYKRYEFHYAAIFGMEDFKIKKNCGDSLSYIGGERSRIEKFKRYYSEVSDTIPVDVYGKWSAGTMKKFPNVNWKGILERGKPKEVYNKSFGSIIIGNKNYEKTGIVSGRFFEVVTAKTLPLIDIDLVDTTISDIFDKDLLKQLVISNSEEIRDLYKKLYDSQERIDLIKECLRQMKQYSPMTSVKMLEDVFHYYKRKDFKPTNISKLIDFFDNILLERESEFDFSKINHNNFVYTFFEKNVIDDSFHIKKKIIEIKYFEKKRCFRCGNTLDYVKGKSAFASREKCDLCKNKEDEDYKKRFELNCLVNKKVYETLNKD